MKTLTKFALAAAILASAGFTANAQWGRGYRYSTTTAYSYSGFRLADPGQGHTLRAMITLTIAIWNPQPGAAHGSVRIDECQGFSSVDADYLRTLLNRAGIECIIKNACKKAGVEYGPIAPEQS
jgi:hypothetical protein